MKGDWLTNSREIAPISGRNEIPPNSMELTFPPNAQRSPERVLELSRGILERWRTERRELTGTIIPVSDPTQQHSVLNAIRELLDLGRGAEISLYWKEGRGAILQLGPEGQLLSGRIRTVNSLGERVASDFLIPYPPKKPFEIRIDGERIALPAENRRLQTLVYGTESRYRGDLSSSEARELLNRWDTEYRGEQLIYLSRKGADPAAQKGLSARLHRELNLPEGTMLSLLHTRDGAIFFDDATGEMNLRGAVHTYVQGRRRKLSEIEIPYPFSKPVEYTLISLDRPSKKTIITSPFLRGSQIREALGFTRNGSLDLSR